MFRKLLVFLILLGLTMGFSSATTIKTFKKETLLENNEMVDVTVLEFLGEKTIKSVKKMSADEVKTLYREFKRVDEKKSLSFEEKFDEKVLILKEMGLIENFLSCREMREKAFEKWKNVEVLKEFLNKKAGGNAVFNMFSSIAFGLKGLNVVAGLNTFIPIVGLDLFSFHAGTSKMGISTNGVFGQQNGESGNYVGVMFGFFGYWIGIGFVVYPQLVCLGVTIATMWLPVPS